MPRGFSEGFLKPKKDGKGDPRLKYKPGDRITFDNLDMITGVFLFRGGSTGYSMRVAQPMNTATRLMVIGESPNNYLVFIVVTRPSAGAVSISNIIVSTNVPVHQIRDIAVDQTDNVYTTSIDATTGLRKYNPSGTFLSNNAAAVGTIASCDKNDTIYLVDSGTLRRYNYSLVLQASYAITGLFTVLADSKDGGCFYSRTVGTDRFVGKVRKNGSNVWESLASTASNVTNLETDEKGNLYVTMANNIIRKYDENGNLLWTSGTISNFNGVIAVIDEMNLIIAMTATSGIYGFVALLSMETGAAITDKKASEQVTNPLGSFTTAQVHLGIVNDKTEWCYIDSATGCNLRKITSIIGG